MSSDVHLMAAGRYAGADEWSGNWAGSWDGLGWQNQGYYDEYGSYGAGDMGGGWELFDVDLNRMVFSLDDALSPVDLYKGLECDDKSLIIVLEAADLSEKSPALWRSRPLKIHPEPSMPAASMISRQERGVRNAAHQQQAGGGGPTNASNAGLEQDLCAAPTPAHESPAPTSVAVTPTQVPSHDNSQVVTPRGLDAAIQRSPCANEPFKLGSPSLKHDLVGSELGPVPAAKPTILVQSPKIVLSNSQLEDLKQKMNILKQKRSATSPMDSPSGSDDKFWMAMSNTDNSDPKKSSDAAVSHGDKVYSNCPGKHGLRPFDTPDRGWWCSICETEHPKGAAFYGCRACDYDECEQCAKREFVKGIARGSPQTILRSPPLKRAAILTPPPGTDDKPAPGVDLAAAKPAKEIRRDLRDRPVKHVRRRRPPPSAEPSHHTEEDDVSEGNSNAEDKAEPEEDSRSDASPIPTSKTLLSRREANKARGRREASETPERWTPRARQGEMSEARQLHGRRRGRDAPAAATKVKIASRKRSAAAAPRSASDSPSAAETSSSEEHRPAVTIKQNVRALTGRTHRMASENRKHVANSPSKSTTKALSDRVGDETPPSRRLTPAADRQSSGSALRAGGRRDHQDLLQKVLRANSKNDGPRRSSGGPELRRSIREGDGGGATRAGAASLKPSSGERSGGPRKAFDQITSQLEKKSRRI